MPLPVFPPAEYDRRVGALQSLLQTEGVGGALLLQKADLYYFCGTVQDAHLYIPVQGDPVLLVRKSLARAEAEAATRHIAPLDSPRRIADALADFGFSVPDRLGMELDVIPANLYLRYVGLWPKTHIVDVSMAIRQVRAVKSPLELDLIRQASAKADHLLGHIRDNLREGMSELELAGMVEGEARRLGHPGGSLRMRMWGHEMTFGHFMAGESAGIPSYLASPNGGPGIGPASPQSAGFRAIAAGEPILADFAFIMDGYISDQTRVFAIGGLPDDLMSAHADMLAVQGALVAAALPGAEAGALYDLAVEKAASLGHADAFMGAEEPRVQFVGHGVGVEIDEFPFIAAGQSQPLEENMVIALEPKLVFPGRGMVGIENTFVVTPRGLSRLSGFPDEVCVVG